MKAAHMNLKKMLKVFCLCLFLPLLTLHAQTKELPQSDLGISKNCATNTYLLDLLSAQLAEPEYLKENLILIARSGKKEDAKSKVNQRRLFTVKKYLEQRTGGKVYIIPTVGDSIGDLGQVEIFVRGKLKVTLIARRCEDIPVMICDDKDADPNYYIGQKFKRKCN